MYNIQNIAFSIYHIDINTQIMYVISEMNIYAFLILCVCVCKELYTLPSSLVYGTNRSKQIDIEKVKIRWIRQLYYKYILVVPINNVFNLFYLLIKSLILEQDVCLIIRICKYYIAN